ncbi:MAG TPA: hypothetical protein VNG53_05645 [Bacteroidia bacterium]|nr:hypothetical protein [Bacteroidia bacterium]
MEISLVNEKPKNVKFAISILVITIILEIILLILRKIMAGNQFDNSSFIFTLLLIGFNLVLVIEMSKRQKWAKKTFLVLVILRIFGVYFTLPILLSSYNFVLPATIIIMILEITAAILLLTKASRNWFKTIPQKD